MTLPLSLVIIHFLGDFLAQNDWMAIHKSKRLDALTLHVLAYTSVLFVVLISLDYRSDLALLFAVTTFLAHWVTDFFTSKLSRKLFWMTGPYTGVTQLRMGQPENVEGATTMHFPTGETVYIDHEGQGIQSRHWFFCWIGFDQVLHYVQLAVTYQWLFGGV